MKQKETYKLFLFIGSCFEYLKHEFLKKGGFYYGKYTVIRIKEIKCSRNLEYQFILLLKLQKRHIKYLKIRLDNGQDLKLSVINNKKISIFTRQICKCVL